MSKRNYRSVLLFISILFLFMSCTQNNKQLLEQADIAVEKQPDSALILLSKIENPHYLEKKEKADYWRIRSEAHCQKSLAMTTDSLILFSLKYYQEVNDTINMLDTYLLAGEHYKWERKLDSVSYILNLGLSKAIAIKDSIYISQYLYQLGSNELFRNENVNNT